MTSFPSAPAPTPATWAACRAAAASMRLTEARRQWLEAAAPDRSHEPPAFCANAERLQQARSL